MRMNRRRQRQRLLRALSQHKNRGSIQEFEDLWHDPGWVVVHVSIPYSLQGQLIHGIADAGPGPVREHVQMQLRERMGLQR